MGRTKRTFWLTSTVSHNFINLCRGSLIHELGTACVRAAVKIGKGRQVGRSAQSTCSVPVLLAAPGPSPRSGDMFCSFMVLSQGGGLSSLQ